MSQREPSYYAIIPASVRYDAKISANAKLLYGELTALAQKEGYCWATNEYFAQLYAVSKRTISEWVSQLQTAGYIQVDVQAIQSGYERKIYIMEILLKTEQKPIEENFHTPTKNTSTPQEENFVGLTKETSTPSGEKLPHSITVSTTLNTTTTTDGGGGVNVYDKLKEMLVSYHPAFAGISDLQLTDVYKTQQDIGTPEFIEALKIVKRATTIGQPIAYLDGIIAKRRSKARHNPHPEHSRIVNYQCPTCYQWNRIPLDKLESMRGKTFKCGGVDCETIHSVDDVIAKHSKNQTRAA
jgi:hypothetical protein